LFRESIAKRRALEICDDEKPEVPDVEAYPKEEKIQDLIKNGESDGQSVNIDDEQKDD